MFAPSTQPCPTSHASRSIPAARVASPLSFRMPVFTPPVSPSSHFLVTNDLGHLPAPRRVLGGCRASISLVCTMPGGDMAHLALDHVFPHRCAIFHPLEIGRRIDAPGGWPQTEGHNMV